jgi:hypothetical protein
MKTALTTLISFLLSLSISGCVITDNGVAWWGDSILGSGVKSSETRAFDGLRGVRLATNGTMHVIIGDEEKIEIEGDDNILPYIATEMSNGILTIRVASGFAIRSRHQLRYTLTARSLHHISTSSSGDIYVDALENRDISIATSSSGDIAVHRLRAERVELSTSSSGDIGIRALKARELSASISSSGDIRIQSGDVDRQTVRISSSGDYEALPLASRRADVRLSSSGDGWVHVTDQLYARISSSGSIHVRGNPSLDARSSSSGKVRFVQ